MFSWIKKIFAGSKDIRIPVSEPIPSISEGILPAKLEKKLLRISEPVVNKPEPLVKELRPYQDFVNAIGQRESSNSYTVVNKYGYLGRYQFGLARLSDFGLCTRISGSVGYSNKSFRWVAPYSEELFLSTPLLQDKIFEVHVAEYQSYISRNFGKHLNSYVNGSWFSLSGAIACCHLLGIGGLRHFVKGEDTSDANGTMASDYIEEFADYLIPTNLDRITDIRIENYLATPT